MVLKNKCKLISIGEIPECPDLFDSSTTIKEFNEFCNGEYVISSDVEIFRNKNVKRIWCYDEHQAQILKFNSCLKPDFVILSFLNIQSIF
jgi:hypothetical protein